MGETVAAVIDWTNKVISAMMAGMAARFLNEGSLELFQEARGSESWGPLARLIRMALTHCTSGRRSPMNVLNRGA